MSDNQEGKKTTLEILEVTTTTTVATLMKVDAAGGVLRFNGQDFKKLTEPNIRKLGKANRTRYHVEAELATGVQRKKVLRTVFGEEVMAATGKLEVFGRSAKDRLARKNPPDVVVSYRRPDEVAACEASGAKVVDGETRRALGIEGGDSGPSDVMAIRHADGTVEAVAMVMPKERVDSHLKAQVEDARVIREGGPKSGVRKAADKVSALVPVDSTKESEVVRVRHTPTVE